VPDNPKDKSKLSALARWLAKAALRDVIALGRLIAQVVWMILHWP